MKRVFYPVGPPTLMAGIGGRFNLGKAKPVSDKIAALLLSRPEFKEAAPDMADDETQDIKALEAEALAADKQDARDAKAAEKAANKKEEVNLHA
ncbi:MAG: hypothetical protein A2076_13170 [Geobacteraceae bacterium GWC2_53_11]|nr:MAG: hypothetical protein A2076_13170 [Geobacteraceae bacterium GWC2_53_11]